MKVCSILVGRIEKVFICQNNFFKFLYSATEYMTVTLLKFAFGWYRTFIFYSNTFLVKTTWLKIDKKLNKYFISPEKS